MDLEEHNRRQRDYFERSFKRTMVPVDSPYLARHVEEVLRAAQDASAGRVLEVGCGMGRYTLLLAKRGVQVEGLDLSEALLARLRSFEAGRHAIPLHCADIARLPQELVGRFDLVLGFFTLHHVHDLVGCFRGVARALKPGGRVVFLEPNAFNPLFYIQILVTPGMTWEGDKGILGMRRRKVFQAMTQAGFETLTLGRFGFFPPFLVSRPFGRRLEAVFESFRPWFFVLPFQLFGGLRP